MFDRLADTALFDDFGGFVDDVPVELGERQEVAHVDDAEMAGDADLLMGVPVPAVLNGVEEPGRSGLEVRHGIEEGLRGTTVLGEALLDDGTLEVAHVLGREVRKEVVGQTLHAHFQEETERCFVSGTADPAVPALLRRQGVVVESFPALAFNEGVTGAAARQPRAADISDTKSSAHSSE